MRLTNIRIKNVDKDGNIDIVFLCHSCGKELDMDTDENIHAYTKNTYFFCQEYYCEECHRKRHARVNLD